MLLFNKSLLIELHATCNTPISVYQRTGSGFLGSSQVIFKLINLQDLNDKWIKTTVLASRK